MNRMLSAYLFALISGTQGRSCGTREPQQLRDLRGRQHQLEDAAVRGLSCPATVVAQKAQDDRKGIVDRQERVDPALKVAAARGRVAVQPVVVRGQIEFADPARDRRALLDRHQPFVVAQMHAGLARLCQQCGARPVDVGEQRFEHADFDRRVGAQRREQLLLSLEFLQQFGLEIRARRDVRDLEERGERGMMVRRLALRRKELRAVDREPRAASAFECARSAGAHSGSRRVGEQCLDPAFCLKWCWPGDRRASIASRRPDFRCRSRPAPGSGGRVPPPAGRWPPAAPHCRECRRPARVVRRGTVARP